jgi:hypothetical protein
MDWSEDWRSAERPDAGDIPDEYMPLRTRKGVVMGSYFTVVVVAYYLAIKFVGTQPMLVMGYPVLMWLTLGMGILFLIGLYALMYRTSLALSEASADREAEVVGDD